MVGVGRGSSRCNNIIDDEYERVVPVGEGEVEVAVPHLLRPEQDREAGYPRSHSGRRLPKELCINEPTLEELARAVCLCQLRNIIEPHKAYSRDYFQMGRLKV